MAMSKAFASYPKNPKTKEFQNILSPKIPKKTQRSTNDLADYLVSKYKSPEFRPLFLRVAWRLDQATISRIVEASFSGTVNNHRAYFIAAVKKENGY